ncbi:MAG: hypothetical protein Q4B05_01120 [Candidatus Saccharibacteria bacterium]|nr:hypothetical protein [Candidatus Saccharibacteria bacterium]
MSTIFLTVVATLAGTVWLLTGAAYSFWKRRLAHALAQLGALALIGHLALIALAWAGAAQDDWSAPSIPAELRWLAEPASQLPTWFFNLSAWAAIILLMASALTDAVQQYRARQR